MNEISKDSYGKLYSAWLMICYDCGMINRAEPEQTVYLVSQSSLILSQAETELDRLNAVDFEEFCTGEERNRENLVRKLRLETAEYVLGEWFDGRF